jgi:hypothetical protein
MKQRCSRIITFLVGIVCLSWTPVALSAESCSQIELTPGSEATVSVLLPDTAKDLQPRLSVRNVRAAGPVDSWGTCPTTTPYGPAHPQRTLRRSAGTTSWIPPTECSSSHSG